MSEPQAEPEPEPESEPEAEPEAEPSTVKQTIPEFITTDEPNTISVAGPSTAATASVDADDWGVSSTWVSNYDAQKRKRKSKVRYTC